MGVTAQTSFTQRVQLIERKNARYVPDSKRSAKSTSFLISLGLGVGAAVAVPVLTKLFPEILAYLPQGGEAWLPDAILAGTLAAIVAYCLSLTATKHILSLALGLGVTLGMAHDLLPDPQTLLSTDPAELRQAYVVPLLAYLPDIPVN